MKINLNERKIGDILSVCLIVVSILLAACSTNIENPNKESIESDSKYSSLHTREPDLEITAASEEITYTKDVLIVNYSIPQLANKSSIIVIGKVRPTSKYVNLSREITTLKPDPTTYGIGVIYEVEVEEYVKGDGEKTIYYVQYQGDINDIEGRNPSIYEIEKAIKDSNYAQLEKDQKTLMFLDKSIVEFNEVEERPLFVGVGYPSIFDISDPECVIPIDIVFEIKKYFPPQPITTLLEKTTEKFDTSMQLNPVPYPAPEMSGNCTGKRSTPYP